MGFENWRLRNKIFIPTIGIMLVIATLLGSLIQKQEREAVEAQARQTARAIAEQVAADRSVYTQEVVAKLMSDNPEISAVATKDLNGAHRIPLPASFVHLTSNVVNARGLHTIDLLSKHYINPEKQPKPASQAEKAMEALLQSPSSVPTYIEGSGADTRLVSVTADVANVQACVDCHNRHPDSKKKDFRLNDVMGALYISVPIGAALETAQANAIKVTSVLVAFFVGVLVVIAAIQWRFISKPLLALEQAADKSRIDQSVVP